MNETPLFGWLLKIFSLVNELPFKVFHFQVFKSVSFHVFFSHVKWIVYTFAVSFFFITGLSTL